MQVRIDPAQLGMTPPENKLPTARPGSGAPRSIVSGALRGVGILAHHGALGAAALVGAPAVGARDGGCAGCAKGACAGLAGAVVFPALGLYKCCDRFARGCANTPATVAGLCRGRAWDPVAGKYETYDLRKDADRYVGPEADALLRDHVGAGVPRPRRCSRDVGWETYETSSPSCLVGQGAARVPKRRRQGGREARAAAGGAAARLPRRGVQGGRRVGAGHGALRRARRRPGRVRGRDQEGLLQEGPQGPPGQAPGRRRRRGAVPEDRRGLPRARRRGRAAPLRRHGRRGGRGGQCGNQPLVWAPPTKLQNSLSRSNRSRFG